MNPTMNYLSELLDKVATLKAERDDLEAAIHDYERAIEQNYGVIPSDRDEPLSACEVAS